MPCWTPLGQCEPFPALYLLALIYHKYVANFRVVYRGGGNGGVAVTPVFGQVPSWIKRRGKRGENWYKCDIFSPNFRHSYNMGLANNSVIVSQTFSHSLNTPSLTRFRYFLSFWEVITEPFDMYILSVLKFTAILYFICLSIDLRYI